MKLAFKSVKLVNFRKHQSTKIDFAYGADNINLILGNNGSGKTSTNEAIAWALFGTSSISYMQSTGDHLIRTGTNLMEVELELTDGTNIKRAKSRSSPQTVSIDGFIMPTATDANNRIKQLLNIDIDTFLASMYSTESGHNDIVGLKSVDRRDMIQSMFVSKIWESAKDVASEKLKNKTSLQFQAAVDKSALQTSLDNLELHIVDGLTSIGVGDETQLVDEIAKIESAIISESNKKTNAKIGLANTLSTLQMKSETYGKLATNTRAELSKLNESIMKCAYELGIADISQPAILVLMKQKSTNLNAAKADILTIKSKIKEVDKEMMELSWQVDSINTSINSVRSSKGTCPTCIQTVTDEHIGQCVQDLSQSRAPLDETLKLKSDCIGALEADLTSKEQNEKEFADELRKANIMYTMSETISQLQLKLSEQINARNIMESEIAAYKPMLKQDNTDKLDDLNSRLDVMKRLKIRIDDKYDVSSKLVTAHQTYNDATKKVEIYKQCDEIFSQHGIQNYALSKVVSDVENIMNVVMKSVGMNATVHMCVTNICKQDHGIKATKNALEIYYIRGSNISPVSLLSNGEKTMVELLFRIAISSIVCQTSNLNVFILDEGFGALDKNNIMTARLIIDWISSAFDQVILITHVDSLATGSERIISL